MAFRVGSMQFGPILANVVGVAAAVLIPFTAVIHHGVPPVFARQENPPSITIDYPLNGRYSRRRLRRRLSCGVTPRRPPIGASKLSLLTVKSVMHFKSRGAPMSVGEIDQRCISKTNELPKLTPEQAAAHTWKPDPKAWEKIKNKLVATPAQMIVTGYNANESKGILSIGRISIQTSKIPVGAPIFYRDVPLMPSETEKGIIKPLAANAIQLIEWRLRSIDQTQSRLVLTGMHTCANCHSFSMNGKTMGMDMDGPRNDKGLYAVVPVKQQMTIRA